jgi:hypothetical protein
MAFAKAVSSRRESAREILSFAELIKLWPRMIDLANDCGLSWQAVASWRRRSSVPQVHWEAIERSAIKRNIHGITYDYLRLIAADSQLAWDRRNARGPKTNRVPPRSEM